MKVEQMLAEVKAISDKYDLLYKKTGGYFNIFEITNTAYKEVAICRVIHELISPKGSHCQGDLYLKMFITDVLHLNIGMGENEFSEEEIKTAEVIREYLIKDDRRIDLVIKTHSIFIPIEVKIFAEDQPKQCFDYYHCSENQKSDKVSNVFYLTRFGNNPSKESAEGLTILNNNDNNDISYKEVTCIPFATDILNWLDNCLKHINTIQIAPIREVILQLMTVIRKFTGKLEKNKENEMKELLKSPENMKNAIAIASGINEAKTDLLCEFFNAVDIKVKSIYEKKSDQCPRWKHSYDFDGENDPKNFYSKYNQQPGITFYYKKSTEQSNGNNVELAVRLEIRPQVSIGYYWDCNQYSNCNENREIVKSMLPREKQNNVKNWWAYIELMPNNDNETCPNFRECNDAYFELYDKDIFNAFVEKCVKRIEELINDK